MGLRLDKMASFELAEYHHASTKMNDVQRFPAPSRLDRAYFHLRHFRKYFRYEFGHLPYNHIMTDLEGNASHLRRNGQRT
jgi:hypothetical protein